MVSVYSVPAHDIGWVWLSMTLDKLVICLSLTSFLCLTSFTARSFVSSAWQQCQDGQELLVNARIIRVDVKHLISLLAHPVTGQAAYT